MKFIAFRIAIAATAFGSVFLFAYSGYDLLVVRMRDIRRRYLAEVGSRLEDMFSSYRAERILYLTLFGILACGAGGLLLLRHPAGGLLGAAAGACLPRFYLRWAAARRSRLFDRQLVEAITLLANGLRAGFSLAQGLALIVREMPPPIRDEIGLLLDEHRLGKPLEEALRDFGKRVKSEEWNLVLRATLVARETGGNIAEIYLRIGETIRERYRVQGKIDSMTAQGKMQGWVVGLMPVGLLLAFRSIDPKFLAPMFGTLPGRLCLLLVALLEGIGGLLLWRMTRIPI